MRLKQIFTTLLLAGVLVVSTTACGNNTTSGSSSDSSISTASQASAANTAEAEYSTDNDTKVKQMLDKVTVNGKPLKIPYKLSDLGEGFSFDSDVSFYGDENEYVITNLNYNGKSIDSVCLYNYKEGQKEDEMMAYTIGYTLLCDEELKNMVQIDGIDGNSTIDDVINKFGEPTLQEKYSNDKRRAIYYRIEDNSDISFCGDEEGNITSIYIENNIS